MIKEILQLKQLHRANTLKELAYNLDLSYHKVKNVSCGRTTVRALFSIRNGPHVVTPKKTSALAELIGVVLGDGNIYKFDRCQRLVISCNSIKRQYIKHIAGLVEKVLRKQPVLKKRKQAQCIDVCLYMQAVDEALGLPAGNKIKNNVTIPRWIYKNKKFLTKCLKGLFETDGDYAFNKRFNVQFVEFCNECEALRQSVYEALLLLGYSPQLGKRYVRLAKKTEVSKFLKELQHLNRN